MDRFTSNNSNRVTVQNSIKDSGNQLLKEIIPIVDIVTFREIIPGMNDVFIKAVEEDNPSNR